MQYTVKTDIGNFKIKTKLTNDFLIKENISEQLERKYNQKPQYIILKEFFFKKQSDEDAFLFVLEKLKKLSSYNNRYFKINDYKNSTDKLGYIVSSAILGAYFIADDEEKQILDNLFNVIDIWNYRDMIKFESICKNLDKKQINLIKRIAIQTGLNIDSQLRKI